MFDWKNLIVRIKHTNFIQNKRFSQIKKKCIICNDFKFIICKKCKGIGRFYEETKEYKCSCDYGIIKCSCN